MPTPSTVQFDVNPSSVSTFVVALVLLLGIAASVTAFLVHASYRKARKKAKYLERELEVRNQDLQRTIEELKATQLKLLESSKLSAVAALSAGILHQLSQPVTAIHGFVRFMKQEMKPDDKFYKPVCLMDEQTVYIKEMLSNLMEMVRHRKVEKTALDVNVILARSLTLLADELRIRRIVWETDFQPAIPKVYADAVHLQQVVMNLVVNAIEALSSLPSGRERRLKILSTFDTSNRQIVIKVRDNGPGMPQQVRDKVFQPFFTTKSSGAGIGLALCQNLVTEHGGDISVESDGTGSEFQIVLPVMV